MIRTLQKLPKVLRGHLPFGSSRSSLPQQPAYVLNENKVDKTSDCDYQLCIRPPGHVTTYSSWVTGRPLQIIIGCFNRHYSHENANQRQQWQSHRNQRNEFEAFGWGTAVVVAIQLCRALSCAKFPDQEHSGISQSVVKVAKLLPIHPSFDSTARTVFKRDDSSDETKSSSSVSYSTDNSCSCDDDLQELSFSSLSLGASLRVDEAESSSGKDENTTKPREQTFVSSDQLLPALEGALSKLSQASKRTQGMIETMMGIQCANLGNDKKAVAHFEAASQLGYSKAQYNLGQCYELGKGVQPDIQKAFQLYKKAAGQDHPLALYKLGAYHFHGIGGTSEDRPAGVGFMERAASLGVILAHSFLGNYYLQSKTRDLHRAIFHLKAAAEEQETESEYLLGLCYEQGWGVTQNRVSAARLYHRAAEGGYPLAMYSLGVYYEKGIGGVMEDKRRAKQLYKEASDRGLDLATKRLEQLCLLEKQDQRQRGDEEDVRDNRAIVTSDNSVINEAKAPNSSSSRIHVSNSEPCLQVRGEETRNLRESSVTLSYLSLILPAILRTNDTTGSFGRGAAADAKPEDHVDFQIGSDEDDVSNWRSEPVNNIELTV